MKPTTVLQMNAVSDIGQYMAPAPSPTRRLLNRREIDILGDAVTNPQAASPFSKAMGWTIEFVQIPIEEVRKNNRTSRSCSNGSSLSGSRAIRGAAITETFQEAAKRATVP